MIYGTSDNHLWSIILSENGLLWKYRHFSTLSIILTDMPQMLDYPQSEFCNKFKPIHKFQPIHKSQIIHKVQFYDKFQCIHKFQSIHKFEIIHKV